MPVGAWTDQFSLNIHEGLVVTLLGLDIQPTSRRLDALLRETQIREPRKVAIAAERDLIESLAGSKEPVFKPFAQHALCAYQHGVDRDIGASAHVDSNVHRVFHCGRCMKGERGGDFGNPLTPNRTIDD